MVSKPGTDFWFQDSGEELMSDAKDEVEVEDAVEVEDEIEVEEEVEERMGRLSVLLVGAKGLRKADFMGKSDPYVELTFLSQQLQTSTTKRQTLNPLWNETFDFKGTRASFVRNGLGDVAAFSFFSNKNMTTGEGGMLTSRSAEHDRALRLLRAHGMTTTTWDRHRGHAFTYDVVRVATNARMDEIRAAIGRIQLGRLAEANRRRGVARRWYLDALASAALPGLQVAFTDGRYGDGAQHLFVVLLPPGVERAAVMASMRGAGVQTSVHYPPTHRFAAYADVPAALPRTDAVADRLLTLPLGPAMGEEHVALVVDALARTLGAHR